MSGPAPLHVCAVCGDAGEILILCVVCAGQLGLLDQLLLTHGSPKLGYYQYWIFWIELLVRFTVCLQHSPVPLPPSISGAAPDLPGERSSCSCWGGSCVCGGVAPAVSSPGRAAAKSSAKAPSPVSAGRRWSSSFVW